MKTQLPFSNFLEVLSILLIPAGLCLHLRQDGGRCAPGKSHPGCHDDHFRGAACGNRLGRAKG